jgi:hypothetical protein
MIEIDTESTLYVCTDGTNAEVHILAPKRTTLEDAIAVLRPEYALRGRSTSSFEHIEHLRLDDPDPYGPHGNDAAVFKLLCESDMEHHTFDI